MIKCGDIGISNRPSGWYPKAVRFFTRSNWSHTFVLIPDYLGEPTVFEADLKAQVVHFDKEYINKKNDSWIIFDPIMATEDEKRVAGEKCFRFYNGQIYGFFQLLWFAARAILKFIGIGKTVRNWFPDGVICSELVLYYLKELGGEYEKAFEHLTLDEVSPQDIYAVIYQRPDLFKFVAARYL